MAFYLLILGNIVITSAVNRCLSDVKHFNNIKTMLFFVKKLFRIKYRNCQYILVI